MSLPWIRPSPFPPVPVGGAVPARPLLAPDFQQFSGRGQWRQGWTHVVAGNFSSEWFGGLLCYDQLTGVAAFYETHGAGDPTLLAEHDDWRTSWTHIAAGRFAHSSYSALLFYDQEAGAGAVYATDGQGGITLLAEDDTLGTSWTEIVVGRYSESHFDGVLLYDRSAGVGRFCSTDGDGHLMVLTEFDDWRTSWTAIVPVEVYDKVGDAVDAGPPYFTDLFFYEGETGYGETYGIDGHGGIMQVGAQRGFPTGARVVSGSFGGLWYLPWTNLMFLDQALTIAQVWAAYGDAGATSDPNDPELPDPHAITWTPNEQLDLGGRGYDVMVPGNFWVAHPDDLFFDGGGFTDLCFYDPGRGDLDFFLKEPQPASIDKLAGYPSRNSVAPGETISIHVSSDVGPFVIDVYQLGAQEQHRTRLWGVAAPGPFGRSRTAYRDGAGWPAASTFTVPSTWPSGLYVARVIPAPFAVGTTGTFETAVAEAAAQPGNPGAAAQAGDSGEVGARSSTPASVPVQPPWGLPEVTLDIPFVVRSVSPGTSAPILVSVPDTTYEAYNFWGGRSLYTHASGDGAVWVYPYNSVHAPRALHVSCRRGFRSVDARIDTAKWKLWEVPFLSWLEQQQIPYELCAVSDLDHHPGLIANYRLFVSIGHDEYWSRQMRTSVENFIAAGGNVAFLSGNTCYWQIRFENGGDTIVCYKDAQMDPLAISDPVLTTVLWSDPPVSDSERKLTGVSGAFLYDPEKAEDWRTYIVTEETHWVFADTGLRDGNAFGTYTRADGQIRTVLGPETDITGPETPGPFNVLALMNDGSKPGNNQTALMVISEGQPGRGTVFSAATIDWVLGLTSGGETPIDQITRNVLERLSDS